MLPVEERLRRLKIRIAKEKQWAKLKCKQKKASENFKLIQQQKEIARTNEILSKFRVVTLMPLDGNEGLLCSYFGCGKQLSLIEKMAGTTCTHHMNRERKPFA